MPDTTILVGDVREKLRDLPDNSVHCVVTSPPYYGLRDYGVDGQIGLEPTLQDFIAGMVDVFREVRRVLRPDGVCWVNMGDGYNNFRTQMGPGQAVHGREDLRGKPAPETRGRGTAELKEKDLLMVPARLAIALCDDGWYLRQDIIWHKPNPMPESVTDRCTKSHEHIFMLAKSARYFYDAEAVKEPAIYAPGKTKEVEREKGYYAGKWSEQGSAGRNDSSFKAIRSTRNPRDVWTIATKPYPGNHFATFPPELPERCIKASTSEKGVCPSCGAPWKREVEKQSKDVPRHPVGHGAHNPPSHHAGQTPHRVGGFEVSSVTVGWSPTCFCPPAEPVPATVLDPFGGAGTTALVARRLGRDATLIELNPAYVKMTEERLAPELGVFDLIRCV